MSRLLAIDPGNEQSAWVIVDIETRRPIAFAKDENAKVRGICWGYGTTDFEEAAIEMIASYGMAVGREVFETCVWIGRLAEALEGNGWDSPRLVYRREVKLHHCHSSKATDSNIRQALVDRFAPGQPNHGKGTKAEPGWFHGFAKDVWAAYALGVYRADVLTGFEP